MEKVKISETPKYPSPFTDGDYGEGYSCKTVIEQKILKELQPHFEEKTINYAIDEALYYSDIFTESLVPGAVDCTYIDDDCVPEELLNELKENVAKLEDVPEHEKDWHPGSDNQVLDLVHPSLYPVVFGRTRGLAKDVSSTEVPKWDSVIGKGETDCVILPPIESIEHPYVKNRQYTPERFQYRSEKYQWLPTEFGVDADGKVKILSYINNLHPEIHEKMYGTLEKIFEKFIPLFNNVLTDSCEQNKKNDKLRISSNDYNVEEFEDYFNRLRKEEAEKNGTEFVRVNEEDADEEDIDECYETYDDEKLVTIPEDYKFSPESVPKNNITVDLKGSRLQVIVKLANIILTPEKPTYKGGVWHVEGMLNEEIVATGIHYYDQENITDSYLAFRQSIREPDYEQNDNKGVKEIYNLEDEGPLNQRLGEIKTVKNRIISFPNIYQHQVQDFELQDKTKPGYRKRLNNTVDIPKTIKDISVPNLIKILSLSDMFFFDKKIERITLTIIETPRTILTKKIEELIEDGGGQATFNYFKTFQSLTADVIGELTFGKSFNAVPNDGHPMTEWVNSAIQYGTLIQACLTFRFFRFMFSNLEKDKFNVHIMQMYMTAKNNDGKKLSYAELVSEMFLMLVAGIDTTSVTMSWLLHIYMVYPDVYRKVVEEIDSVFPDRSKAIKSQEARAKLPYFMATVYECMRLKAAVSGVLFRENNNEGIELSGYYIPPKVDMGMFTEGAHNDTEIWEKPDSFIPERFLGKEGDRLKKEVIVFSFGVRICAGRNLAWAEITTVIPNLMRNYNVRLPDDSRYGVNVLDKNRRNEPLLLEDLVFNTCAPANVERDCNLIVTHRA
ncbi:hypothetical protein BB558_007315 [Smittium angustum]|uniref:DUF4246 domain-containing protein n=1 Tax=Smittium angustum TaxID=133377 RepID=A0A2U1IVB7_SMIAN|nr:hypothetical protein BB558_007315 [Smittium angustum]